MSSRHAARRSVIRQRHLRGECWGRASRAQLSFSCLLWSGWYFPGFPIESHSQARHASAKPVSQTAGMMNNTKPIEILLIEDNPGDARLAQEALRDAKVRNHLSWVPDGVEALGFLRREAQYRAAPRPDLILLDLNLPRKDGREVLTEIKADDKLRRIPVVILTTSQAQEDIHRAYHLNANCYITKPVDLDQFIRIVKTIEDFWLTIVKLPTE